MTSAGKRLGTTRMFQPGVLAPPPLRPYTRISGGVLLSAPGQKGQFLGPVTRTLSRRKSEGRFPRSVEMMTQRPVMGSLRNSGKASLLEFKSQETDALRMALCLRLYRAGAVFYSWGLKASLWRRTAGEWPGGVSRARTSERQRRLRT